MKIRVDFKELWDEVERIGAKAGDFEWANTREPLELDGELAGGKEIDIGDVESIGGLLSYKGRQILLYIPEQYRIDEVAVSPEKGTKFHLADCRTLKEMRSRNRYNRYVGINGESQTFPVHGTSRHSGEHRDENVELKVCKNCLKHLNYKGYETGPTPKGKIFNEFNISEFFARHTTIFEYLPTQLYPKTKGYTSDWSEVSRKYRAEQNYCCEQCSVNLSEDKGLLHCHHINGNKPDNSYSNLKALCIDCHRRQPMHEHLGINAEQMARINKLREEQGLLDNSWESVIEYADTSFHGLLLNYQRAGLPPPQIGYDVQNSQSEIVANVEVAWPNKKDAVVIEPEVPEALPKVGWSAKTLNEAVLSFTR